MAGLPLLRIDDLPLILEGAEWVTLDFETDGKNPLRDRIVGMSLLSNKGGGYIPLCPYRTEGSAVLHDGQDSKLVGNYLDNWIASHSYCPVIGHNLGYDIHCLRRLTGGRVTSNVVDTQVGLWLLSEETALGLKETLSFIFNEEMGDWKDLRNKAVEHINEELKAARKAYSASFPRGSKTAAAKEALSLFPMRTNSTTSSSDIPIEWLSSYAYRDVVGTAFLWFHYIRPLLKEENLLSYFYSYEMPFLLVLYEMEEAGIEVSLPRLKTMEERLKKEIEEIENRAFSLIGRKVSLASIPEMQALLFEEMAYAPSGRLTKTGNDSLDEKALKTLRLAYPDAPIFKLLLDYREKTKLLSTYAIGLREEADEKSRIHTNYNHCGTVTGRLSSSEPNLQNQVKNKELRSCFTAPPTRVIIKSDYGQAELRILADRTSDPILLSVYREGRDIHQETMERLKLEREGRSHDVARKMAKTCNFLICYGGGPKTYYENLFFDYDVRDYSIEQCKEDIKNFYTTYAAINQWKKAAINKGRGEGKVKSRFGRARHLPFLGSSDLVSRSYAERQCVNFLIQGDVADLVKAAMILTNSVVKEYGGRLLCQVHDELIFEVPKAEAEDFAFELKGIMENIWKLEVPIKVDVEMGPSWGECK